MALHLHLVTLCNNEGWDYANESLKYHANKLSEIHQCAPCRLLYLLKIYIFLHEARKQDFYFLPKLHEKCNKAMLTKLLALEVAAVQQVGQPEHQPECARSAVTSSPWWHE